MKLPTDLKRAMVRARSAVETHNKIAGAIETAVSLQPAAEARLHEAMEALGAAEAEAAISGEAPSMEAAAARSALADARQSVEVLAARLSGLQHRLSSHRAEVVASVEEMESALEEFTRSRLDEFRGVLLRAAADFATVLRQGAALADALGAGHVEMAIRGIAIRDPMKPDERLLDMTAIEFQERGFVPVSIWKGDPAAETVFDDYSEIGVVARALKACQ